MWISHDNANTSLGIHDVHLFCRFRKVQALFCQNLIFFFLYSNFCVYYYITYKEITVILPLNNVILML